MRYKLLKMALFLVAVAVLLGVAILADQQRAQALSNPLRMGKNITATATNVAAKVAATGQRCSVVIVNSKSNDPVYTGYTGVTTANGIPVCADTTVAGAGCVGTMITRDATPDAIWYVTAGPAVPIRIELGDGCLQ